MARYIQSVGLVLVLLTLCLAECSFKWAALEGDICASLSAEWNIAIEQFELWNPGVDCTEPLKAQQEYCIEWTGPESTAPTTSTIVTLTATAKATSTTSKTTSIPAEPSSTHPSPVQPDIEKTCTRYHKVVSGDTCEVIVAKYRTFTLANFYKWNPSVGDDCTGLWLEYYVCIGVPGTPTVAPSTTKPLATTHPTTSTTIPSGPFTNPTRHYQNLSRFHKAVDGDHCAGIVQKYGTFSLQNFITWNPAVKSDCSGLWLGYYYCIGIPGTPTTKPTSTLVTTTRSGPTPTQTGIDKRCKKFHKVKTGDNCQKIADGNKIKLADFYKWNPAVGKDCSTLWAGYYVCVGI